jgi:hypothetical protein
MSTPISRHNKLQGLALYAPRRVREQFDAEELPTAPPIAEPESDRTEEGANAYAGADADRDDEANAAEIHAWLDQAIREAVELGRAAEAAGGGVPEIEIAHAPRTAPIQSEADDWPPETPEPRSQRYRTAATRPPRPPRLEAEIVPEPPAELRRSNFFRLFARFSLVVAFAAIAAYGLTMLPSLQPVAPPFKSAANRVAAAVPQSQPQPQQTQPAWPPARLIVKDRQAAANEPVSLPIVVEHGAGNDSLLVNGLVQGTTLSAGTRANAFSWWLPFDKLRGLYLYAPKDFVGVMNTTVDLLGGDQRLLDSGAMQLKWNATQPKPSPVTSLATATADASAGHPTTSRSLTAPVVAPTASIDPAEASMLMQRGRDFLSTGDISAARVAFRRLADGGMADAALALANTYDPDYLAAHNVVGVSGDRATARALYQRAKQLGSPEAGRILAQMTGN